MKNILIKTTFILFILYFTPKAYSITKTVIDSPGNECCLVLFSSNMKNKSDTIRAFYTEWWGKGINYIESYGEGESWSHKKQVFISLPQSYMTTYAVSIFYNNLLKKTQVFLLLYSSQQQKWGVFQSFSEDNGISWEECELISPYGAVIPPSVILENFKFKKRIILPLHH